MIRIALFAALLTAPALTPAPFAQSVPDWAAPVRPEAGPTESSDPPPPPIRPPAVPIDGGLGLLALAGAGLAARRLRAAE